MRDWKENVADSHFPQEKLEVLRWQIFKHFF